jgi:hypothetical protein
MDFSLKKPVISTVWRLLLRWYQRWLQRQQWLLRLRQLLQVLLNFPQCYCWLVEKNWKSPIEWKISSISLGDYHFPDFSSISIGFFFQDGTC